MIVKICCGSKYVSKSGIGDKNSQISIHLPSFLNNSANFIWFYIELYINLNSVFFNFFTT